MQTYEKEKYEWIEAGKAALGAGLQWEEGMLTLPFHEGGDPEKDVCQPGWRVRSDLKTGPWTREEQNNRALPDLRDRPTMGCLSAQMYEAWDTLDPDIVVSVVRIQKHHWEVWVNSDHDFDLRRVYRSPQQGTVILDALRDARHILKSRREENQRSL